jgi:hypothetical protein
MNDPSWAAEGRLKAGGSQDWLPHKLCTLGVMSNLCHPPFQRPERADEEYVGQ